MVPAMNTTPGKRTAKVRVTLTKRTVEALEPAEKSWLAWDDKLPGFGIRVQPSGTKSFIVNYRTGDGGRNAPNKRIVIGRFPRVAPDKARRIAQDVLGRVARGEDPAGERAEARGVPTLIQAFEDYMAANPNRAVNTIRLYRQNLRVNLADWRKRPLDSITRKDVEDRFNLITGKHGWSAANQTLSMLRSISTVASASTTKACAIRSSCGWPRAGASTASGGGGYRPRPRCCRAGARASTPWTSNRRSATSS